jgi:hypothetical protein
MKTYFQKFKKLSITFIILVSLITTSTLAFTTVAKNPKENEQGFNKGSSYLPVNTVKKTTLVNYNENSYLDDYAYFASIPTAVFKNNNQLYSHPLLFYQDSVKDENKILTSNGRTGLNYFMEDWESANNDVFDEITTINIPTGKINQWNAETYNTINSDSPEEIAEKIALHDWSYSDEAVLANINTNYNDKSKTEISNMIKSSIQPCDVKKISKMNFVLKNRLKPEFNIFQIDNDYKHVKADVYWDILIDSKKIGMISSADPAGNPDVQFYSPKNNDWIQTSATCSETKGPYGHKYANAHINEPGKWKISISDIPTQELSSNIKQRFSNFLQKNKLTYYVDITMYPGVDIEIPDVPEYKSQNAFFKLKWDDPKKQLGFSIIGPNKESIFTKLDETKTGVLEIKLNELPEILDDKKYSLSVFSKNDVTEEISFEVEYGWETKPGKNRDSLTSASEGSILASQLNAPLLYAKNGKISESTEKVLFKLGVKKIYLVDINKNIDVTAKYALQENFNVKYYSSLKKIYDKIRDFSKNNDVIFSTIESWIDWDPETLKPNYKESYGLSLGPAAFIAAHHGSPVLIIENHPELSSAALYHNQLWNRYSTDRKFHRPSDLEMYLTGTAIYEFLKEYGFDKNDEKETIITVAGQYNIGPSWDRIFPGVANSGRFFGNPVDISYWVSRNIFYPILVFENPGVEDEIELINGSSSYRDTGLKLGNIKNFVLTKDALIQGGINYFRKTSDSKIEVYKNPVLCSFLVYQHRFNERASKYYGEKYVCADGTVPGETVTDYPIDSDIMKVFTGSDEMVFPDITESEIIPLYLKKGGFDSVYSTSKEAVVENLNQGVLLWIHGSHGDEKDGGTTLFWNPQEGFENRDNYFVAKLLYFHKSYLDLQNNKIVNLLSTFIPQIKGTFKLSEPKIGVFQDDNPWRAYEWYMGSTDEPDTMAVDIKGMLPYTSLSSSLFPSLNMPYVASYEPFKVFLNNIIPFTDPFNVESNYDGVVGSFAQSKFQYNKYSSFDIEKNLENLHSTGFITSICNTGGSYLHLMLVRHGSVFQIQNPWPSSIYSSVWMQSIPRDIVSGASLGEAYANGLEHVGSMILSKNNKNQWWWDSGQNLIYYGDPNLRVYVPDSNYDDSNTWEKPVFLKYSESNVDGHTVFGAEKYPHERQPVSLFERYFYLILFVSLITLVLILIFSYDKVFNRGESKK